jgi:hypothetical protein
MAGGNYAPVILKKMFMCLKSYIKSAVGEDARIELFDIRFFRFSKDDTDNGLFIRFAKPVFAG